MTRRLTKLAMSLLLGAAINVAVAWAGALLIRVDGLSSEEAGWFLADQYGGPRVWITSLDRIGAVRHVIQFSHEWPINVSEQDGHLFPKWSRGAEPRRIDTMKETAPHEPIDDLLVEDARGWPMLSLHCEYVIALAVDNQTLYVRGVSGGIAVHKGSNAPMAPGTIEIRSRILRSTALPLRPIWPGFLLNTLLYAAICGLLFAAPLAARRGHRRRRGRCIRCGCDLRDRPDDAAACPECGGVTGSSSRSPQRGAGM